MTKTKLNFQTEIKGFLDVLERKSRKDKDESFICFKQESILSKSPYYERLSTIIRDFKGSEDFAYRQVYNCLMWIDENFEKRIEDLRDELYESVDAEVDVYTSDLTSWLAENINHVYYLTEVLEEFGADGVDKDGFKLLMMAQYKAIEEIWQEVLALFVE